MSLQQIRNDWDKRLKALQKENERSEKEAKEAIQSFDVTYSKSVKAFKSFKEALKRFDKTMERIEPLKETI